MTGWECPKCGTLWSGFGMAVRVDYARQTVTPVCSVCRQREADQVAGREVYRRRRNFPMRRRRP